MAHRMYRVWLEAPGSDKPKQAICSTEKSAREFLTLLLDAGQPAGTQYVIYKTEEREMVRGEVK